MSTYALSLDDERLAPAKTQKVRRRRGYAAEKGEERAPRLIDHGHTPAQERAWSTTLSACHKAAGKSLGQTRIVLNQGGGRLWVISVMWLPNASVRMSPSHPRATEMLRGNCSFIRSPRRRGRAAYSAG
jgi:hypothetical protein